MNKIILLSALLVTIQTGVLSQQYPTPEFSNEIYFFSKDISQVLRLEKGYSKAESKTKLGGMGGGENGYALEGSRSAVRLKEGHLSFIVYQGGDDTERTTSDSISKANGMDLSSFGNPMAMLNDPSTTTSLFNMNVDKGGRKITLQSYHGMKILGKSKRESTKFTFSLKKVRNGYYELIVDKPLTKGEYAFLVTDMTMGMDGNSKLFAFGID